MLFALLAFGTIPFYIVSLLSFFILIAFVENEKSIGAVLTIIVTGALLYFFGNKGIIPWAIHNPVAIAEYIGGYLVLGIIWGFIKWFFYVLKARDRYETFRAEWLKYEGPINDEVVPLKKTSHWEGLSKTEKEVPNPDPTDTWRARFLKSAKSNNMLPPSANHNKGKIIFWMSYWPASGIWTLINDPITRIYQFLFTRIVVTFEHISQAMFSKYKDDFAVKEVKKN
jgi:hypothetical protein